MKLIDQVDLRVYDDLDELTRELTKDFLALHQRLINKFYVFPGGNTPKLFYKCIASKVQNWHNTTILLSDERYVQETDEESNTRMLKSNLLENISQNVLPNLLQYPLPDSTLSLDNANIVLRNILDQTTVSLSLLGLGSDGHFASLFPPFISKYHSHDPMIMTEKKGHKTRRISLAYNVFLNSNQIWFILTGLEKANVLKDILMEKNNVSVYPAYKLLKDYKKSRIRFYCDKYSVKYL